MVLGGDADQLSPNRGWLTFSKGEPKIVNILVFLVIRSLLQLLHSAVLVGIAIDNMKMNSCGCGPIKLYLQKWPTLFLDF